MMRWNHGILMLGVGLSACSGRYEVGGMDAGGSGGNATAGTSAMAGTGATGIAGDSSNPAGGAATGGSGTAGAPTPAGECVPLGMPKALGGEFATPEVVWDRISTLIWGEWMPPPSGFPEVTTPAWVNQAVTAAFEGQAPTVPQYMNGPRVFLVQWLDIELDADEEAISFPFSVPWGPLLAEDKPALPILLQTPLGEPGHEGIFTEPRWLAEHTTISSRGTGISASLMQNAPPPPPQGLMNPEADPNLPDREALARQTVSPPCAACHHIIDPLAFELGNLDAAGNYRELDHGQPVDTTGTVQVANLDFSYNDLGDFNRQMAETCDANLALADGFLRAALVINNVPGDRDALFQANYERLRQFFYRGGRSYPDLVRAYAQSSIVLRP